MKLKEILFSLLFYICGSSGVAVAQEMCFKNSGLKMEYTVAFLLVGNKVTEGEFSSWNYDAATSGETTSFTGTKTGNTLTIKFSNKAPYALPPNTKQIVWTLKKNQLLIPTYGKDYTTNKYTTYQAEYDLCASVKSDDYEENTKPKIVEKKCACQAFITDPDKGG